MATKKANERTTLVEGLRPRARSVFVDEAGSWRLEAMASLLQSSREDAPIEPQPIRMVVPGAS
ncbi:MAG TPA: hypothetical protein VIF15_02765 [Polyangiaceae bacterium]|jgi:hypothetical protein